MRKAIVALLIYFSAAQLQAQTIWPVSVTGFNHDVIAESFPNAVASTDTVLDATNHIMYTQGFAASAGISAGLPNSGLINDASNTRQYQLQPYNGNNVLTVTKSNTKNFTLTTPDRYSKISLLCFTTEGASTLNISFSFADGSSTQYVINQTLTDWFNGTNNVVIQGFGRCLRVATAPYSPDGLPNEPRFYYIDVTLNCADKQKQLSQIAISNNSTTGVSPWPNAVFLGVSGTVFTQTISATTTPATCSSFNGGATLSITGGTPSSITWNSNPQQSGATLSNVPAGNYTATIQDQQGCSFTQNVTIASQNTGATATATANPAAICAGGSSSLTVTLTGSTIATATWNPGNLSGTTVTVTPTGTTTYTVSGTDQSGCTFTGSATVTINPDPASPSAAGTTICSGKTATLNVTTPVAGETYGWYAAATGGSALSTGTSFTTPALTATTSYYIQASSGAGCTNPNRTPVTVTVDPLPAAPAGTSGSICPGDAGTITVTGPVTGNTYEWYSAATGGTPLATGTSYTTGPLSSPTTFYVQTTSPGGCISSTRGAVTINFLQQLPAPVISVSNISSNSVIFSWLPVSGATGYEVSLDNGATFITPSGTTSHTVTGLIPGQTVTLTAYALGAQVCQNSALAQPVTAVIPDKNLFVPNAFTPNGDGKNDVLLVYSNSLSKIDFKVFNQWGNQIFTSAVVGKGWDGTYLGKPQPVGVYVYVVKATLTDGTQIVKKGSVSLIR